MSIPIYEDHAVKIEMNDVGEYVFTNKSAKLAMKIDFDESSLKARIARGSAVKYGSGGDHENVFVYAQV